MNKNKRFTNYIVIGSKEDIEDIKIVLERVFKSKNNNIYNIISKFITNSRIIIRNEEKTATIYFYNMKTLGSYCLEGLRGRLVLLDDDCPNYNDIYRICNCILLADKGENLSLCKESVHQLVGDILMFLEGVDTNVKSCNM